MQEKRRVLLSAFVLLFCSDIVSAQSTEVTFVNETGQTIYFLYASPISADSWGQDLLGNTVFPAGDVFRVRLRGRGSFDVRAIDSNGDEYIVWDWDFSQQRRVVLRQDKFVGVSSSQESRALAWLNVRNETNYTVTRIVAIQSGSGEWDSGQVFLDGREMLHNGEEYRLEFDIDDDDSLLFDVMLIDEDGDRYIKRNINLRVSGEVTYTLDDIRF